MGDAQTTRGKMVRRPLPETAADWCWLNDTLAVHRQFNSARLEECIDFRMMAATPQATSIGRITNIRRNWQQQMLGKLAVKARTEVVGNSQLRKITGGAKDHADSG